MKSKLVLTLALLALCASGAAAQDEDSGAAAVDSAAVARKLSSRSPFERREAAEELARLASVGHRRLAEG